MSIAADTFCNVCDQCPADTIYRNQPMCYLCRENSAKAAREMGKSDKPCDLCNSERACGECAEDLYVEEREPDYEDNMTDVEADADTLASCGWGTDEDYGYYGDD